MLLVHRSSRIFQKPFARADEIDFIISSRVKQNENKNNKNSASYSQYPQGKKDDVEKKGENILFGCALFSTSVVLCEKKIIFIHNTDSITAVIRDAMCSGKNYY